MPDVDPALADESGTRPRRTELLAALTGALEPIVVTIAAVALAGWLFAAVVHAGDASLVTYDDGARVGLARALRDGTLYPPLFDGIHYGGTRFMPGPIVLHAILSFVTGELFAAGKLATYLSFAGLAATMFAAMRWLGATPARAMTLLGMLVVSYAGVQASLAITYDALPVALQLLAVLVVARSRRRGTVVVAAALCALALFSKLSGLWGFGAIAMWLWRTERRKLRPFLGVGLASSAGLLVLVQLTSGGRFTENLLELSTSGLGVSALANLALSVVEILPTAPAFFLLLPPTMLEIRAAARNGEITPFHLAFGWAAAILVLVQLDAGASTNHALDLLCLQSVLVARRWVRWEPTAGRSSAMPILATFVLISSFAVGLRFPVQTAVDRVLSGTTPPNARLPRLEGILRPDAPVLAEDASVPISLGQEPVVLDPFMLARIAERDPELIDPLIRRIEDREFDHIVLDHPLGAPPREDWYTHTHFGARMTDAIRANYVYLQRRAGFVIYVPRPA